MAKKKIKAPPMKTISVGEVFRLEAPAVDGIQFSGVVRLDTIKIDSSIRPIGADVSLENMGPDISLTLDTILTAYKLVPKGKQTYSHRFKITPSVRVKRSKNLSSY